MASIGRKLRVLIAPDSFKGSLTSVDVAEAVARGWLLARPGDDVAIAPLADGGEGTLGAIHAAGGWSWRSVAVTDPIGRPVRARWLRKDDGKAAFVELAEASGLSRVSWEERDPMRATTFGTGEVLRTVLDDGIRHITLGIGGSATTDGGSGILRALGADFTAWPEVELRGLDKRLSEVTLRIACDVTNPLVGERGAAATYGPQKGATEDQVRELDAFLASYADVLEGATGRQARNTPGAGAAGGTAFGLLAIGDRFRSIELKSGVDLVLEETGAAERLTRSDVVVTGEGRIDEQTQYGKTALGVAKRAAAANVACIAIGGGVTPAGIETLRTLGAIAVPVVERPMTLDEAIAAGTAPVERCGERIAGLVGVGVFAR